MLSTKKNFLIALAMVMALGLAGTGDSAFAAGERFVLVSHAPDSDSWWNTIKNAIRVAAEQVNLITSEQARDTS